MSLEILDPGLLATIQDGGRQDWTHLGVTPGGAVDPVGLAIANALVGNPPDAAAIEITAGGFRARVGAAPLAIGLAGANLGAHGDGRRLASGRSHLLAPGASVELPGGTGPGAGLRAYLAVPGGVDVPLVLGSRSTALAGGFGGHDGRPLRAADVVRAADPGRPVPALAWPAELGGRPELDRPIRILAGPRAGADELVARSWQVAGGSDRLGLRLRGEPLPAGMGGEVVSHGVTWGAIQAPPSGEPIVLLADHQTTGGYPVIGVAIVADRGRLGQLGPGAAVRFEVVEAAAARVAREALEGDLRRGRAALAEAAGWEALAGAAGDWR